MCWSTIPRVFPDLRENLTSPGCPLRIMKTFDYNLLKDVDDALNTENIFHVIYDENGL